MTKTNLVTDCNEILLGIDIGSTTAKVVVVDNNEIIYEKYERHFSFVRSKTLSMINEIEDLLKGRKIKIAISGSAGLGMADAAGLPFVQEVFATAETVRMLEPDTSVVIELGGEDAKVIFFDGGLDERMNGTCAGGTGAFIDQIATLLNVTNEELDALSLTHKRIYPIASRCGVFAKTDIQPLLNQGAQKSDIAASIYQAVVNQTIAGLAQGRKIDGKVMFLGGPLHYCKGLRERFKETLKLDDEHALFPEYGRFSVSIGSAIYASKQNKFYSFEEIISALEKANNQKSEMPHSDPLFKDEKEYNEFIERHKKATVKTADAESYNGNAYLGIDCGSTTTKLFLMSENNEMLYSFYDSNKGNPVEIVKEQLKAIYKICGDKIKIKSSAVTGYGEELIKKAFGVDFGIVETMAHFTAAKYFSPNVDFILDIGGQDIKCFRVHNNSIDSIMLNEACSSGCGSFIETFAKAMGYSAEEFSKIGLYSKAPVDLGTRCTVFMNSSVKQAQKDGAKVEDISAGLSNSVVKNAIYKVIRVTSAEELGENIVVQGGTFLNNAVLRCFEREIGHNCIRPDIAGLMGAYGAALYAKSATNDNSTLISKADLKEFTHKSKSAVCKGCTNQCKLTVNIFNNGEKFISGNQCKKGESAVNKETNIETIPNMFAFKREQLESLFNCKGNRKETVGLPLALGMYELLPLWQGILKNLGFSVNVSGFSDRDIYSKGQFSIPSDTACYPAKISHGHIEQLLEDGVDAIFFPCLSYNIDEKRSANHYNCPVVAYYPELLNGNMDSLKNTKFIFPFLTVNNQKELSRELTLFLSKYFDNINLKDVKRAVKLGFEQYENYMQAVKDEGMRCIEYANKNNKRLMVLAGRPYHIDPEISHGIDKLATSLDFVVVTEDAVSELAQVPKVNVLNQWTYHSRLYAAAEYVSHQKNAEFVQLVSFGCGIDAITTDEVRSILEENDKLYTQIKIDEITNLGAVKIRLRSLLGALEERD